MKYKCCLKGKSSDDRSDDRGQSPRIVLIADDHAVVRTGLRALVECENDMTVVGEADNGEIAVRLAAELNPDTASRSTSSPFSRDSAPPPARKPSPSPSAISY